MVLGQLPSRKIAPTSIIKVGIIWKKAINSDITSEIHSNLFVLIETLKQLFSLQFLNH